MTRRNNKKRADRSPDPDWGRLRQVYIDGNDAASVAPRVEGAIWEEHLFGDWWDREHDFRLQIRSIVLTEDTWRYHALRTATGAAFREALRLADVVLDRLSLYEHDDVLLPEELAVVFGLPEEDVLHDLRDGQLGEPVYRDDLMKAIRWVIGEVD